MRTAKQVCHLRKSEVLQEQQFIGALYELADKCDFTDRSTQIRDRLVVGIWWYLVAGDRLVVGIWWYLVFSL